MTDLKNLDANKDSIAQPESSVKAEGVQPISAQTAGYTFNHTMLRVKDPAKSLAFYTGILGMTLLAVKKFPAMGFDLYFLAKLTDSERENLPAGDDLEIFAFRQRGILELTHNYVPKPKRTLVIMMVMVNHKALVISALVCQVLTKRLLGLIKTTSSLKNVQKTVA